MSAHHDNIIVSASPIVLGILIILARLDTRRTMAARKMSPFDISFQITITWTHDVDYTWRNAQCNKDKTRTELRVHFDGKQNNSDHCW